MKRIIILMLALLLVPAFPVLAGSQLPIKMILSEPSQEEIDKARDFDFKTIKVLTDNDEPNGDFMGVEWINQSVFASTAKTTKYRTMGFEYQIGPYIGYVDGYYFHTPDSPGQEIIEKATITREALINSFMTQGSRAAVEEALDTEAYLYVRARIMIYNDRNGDGKIQADEIVSEITRKDEINTKAAIFPEKNKQDMRSRFQEIPINAGKKPDFYPTPEGSSEWNESYLECAKTYSGEPGEEITFPVNLYNIGTKASTDFRAVWAGQGNNPSAGWEGSNAPFIAEGTSEDGKETNLITLDKEESQTFEVTVTIPDQPTKLYFKANIDEKTPATEQVLNNNTMVILIQPDGIDLEITSFPTMQKGALKGQQVSVDIPLSFYRIDLKEIPVEAEVTWQVTKANNLIDSGSKTTTLNVGDFDKQVVKVTGQPYDTFIVTGEIMPITEKDIDLSNNKTITKVFITEIQPNKTPPATKEDPSPGTRVNLRD